MRSRIGNNNDHQLELQPNGNCPLCNAKIMIAAKQKSIFKCRLFIVDMIKKKFEIKCPICKMMLVLPV